MSKKFTKYTKDLMPPMITFIVLLMIISTAGFTRLIIHKDEIEPVMTYDYNITNETELNRSEKSVITLLSAGKQYSSGETNNELNTYSIFLDYLQEHLCNPSVDLDNIQAKHMEDMIHDFINIVNLEQNNDFIKMSLDARGLAVDLAKKIYQVSGLELTVTVDGTIQKINDRSGEVLYEVINPMEQTNVRWDVLVITLITISSLLVFILFIKRYQAPKEQVVYEIVDDEIYA